MIETKIPDAAISMGSKTKLKSKLPATKILAPRTIEPTIEPTYDSNRSAPIPATSPTLSPTLSAIVAGFKG